MDELLHVGLPCPGLKIEVVLAIVNHRGLCRGNLAAKEARGCKKHAADTRRQVHLPTPRLITPSPILTDGYREANSVLNDVRTRCPVRLRPSFVGLMPRG